MKCSIFCWVSKYILIINLKVQFYCIVTGSCRPFHRSSHLMYTYTGLGRELFVAFIFQWLLSPYIMCVCLMYVCVFSRHSSQRLLSLLHVHSKLCHTMFWQLNNKLRYSYYMFVFIIYVYYYIYICDLPPLYDSNIIIIIVLFFLEIVLICHKLLSSSSSSSSLLLYIFKMQIVDISKTTYNHGHHFHEHTTLTAVIIVRHVGDVRQK